MKCPWLSGPRAASGAPPYSGGPALTVRGNQRRCSTFLGCNQTESDFTLGVRARRAKNLFQKFSATKKVNISKHDREAASPIFTPWTFASASRHGVC